MGGGHARRWGDGENGRPARRSQVLGFARDWRVTSSHWEFGAATSLAMIESEDDGVADARHSFGFDAGLVWSPSPEERLAIGTELDLELGEDAAGLSLDGLGFELSYELRF